MGGTIFSVPIFFVVFREVVEAGIVVSILLSLVDGMSSGNKDGATDPDEAEAVRLRVRKRMRWMVRARSFPRTQRALELTLPVPIRALAAGRCGQARSLASRSQRA